MKIRTLTAAALVLLLTIGVMAQAQENVNRYALSVGYTVTLTAVPVDAMDYQATLPCAAVTWASSDVAKATVIASDAQSAELVGVAPGPVTITATCGSIVQPFAVQVVGPAVALRIGVGEARKDAAR